MIAMLHRRDQMILDEMKHKYILQVVDEKTGALMVSVPIDEEDKELLDLLIPKLFGESN